MASAAVIISWPDWGLQTCNILRVIITSPAVLRSVSGRARLKGWASHKGLADWSCWTPEHRHTIQHRQFNRYRHSVGRSETQLSSSRSSRECANSQCGTVLPDITAPSPHHPSSSDTLHLESLHSSLTEAHAPVTSTNELRSIGWRQPSSLNNVTVGTPSIPSLWSTV